MLTLAQAYGLAQQAPLTIDQAVQQAVDKYPAVRSSLEQVSAAAAGINLARTAYLPPADFLREVKPADHNHVFGMASPLSIITSTFGPVPGIKSLSHGSR